MLIFLIVALLALSYMLSRSTDVLVSGLNQLSKGTSFEAYGLTTLLVALATSLPELFVGIAGALEGKSDLTLGVVLGSNIANVSLIIGGAALVSGMVKAQDRVYRQDILYAFLVAVLPLMLLFDGVLSRVDGLVLLAVYGLFNVIVLTGQRRKEFRRVRKKYYEEQDMAHRVLSFLGKKDIEMGLGKMVVGSVLLIVGADLIVKLSLSIAQVVNVPLIFVGLFMVSIGTSLPELAFEIKTINKREYLMAFGNIIGSTVVNSSLVLGLVSVLSPLELEQNRRAFLISVVGFLVVFGLFWFATYSKKRLERWEGAALLMMYFAFVLIQLNFA